MNYPLKMRRWMQLAVMAMVTQVSVVLAEESAASSVSSATPIVAIHFAGNKQTREQILRQEISLREGEAASAEDIENARQAIMDLGIFESVKATVEERPGGKAVTFEVDEKFYFLPIPLLSGDPNKGTYSYGLELRVDNLGGLNQNIGLKYQAHHSDEKQVPFSREGSISYTYPRVAGSPYALALNYAITQEDFNEFDANDALLSRYHRNVTTSRIGVSRWLNIAGPSRGWFGGIGLNYQEQAYTYLSGVPNGFETTQAMSLSANIGSNEVHDYGYYMKGDAYGWNGELGTGALGSDYEFTRHLFYWRSYNHFNPKLNLNWQVRLGFADGRPFGGDAYSVGGFKTLRGYTTSISGNALALTNLEYHHQIDDFPSVRGVWFLDVGNAYRRVVDMDPGKLESGSGFGLRWRVQSLVNVTVSADAAYGFGPKKTVFYLMTTGTF